jgi:Nucleotide modification associated domain 2
MAKIYIYKLTVDDGGAPCVRGDTLSLAICKPAMRFTAKRGSIVLGFAATRLCKANTLYQDNCLIYAAKLTDNLCGRTYFSDRRYAARPDCIYSWDGRRFERKSGAKFHSKPSDLVHDLGQPPGYRRANVLLSKGPENFRYFRDECPIRYKKQYPRLQSLVESLKRGHRVNFSPDLRAELDAFTRRLWHEPFAYRETYVPDVPCEDKCSIDDDFFAEVEC